MKFMCNFIKFPVELDDISIYELIVCPLCLLVYTRYLNPEKQVFVTKKARPVVQKTSSTGKNLDCFECLDYVFRHKVSKSTIIFQTNYWLPAKPVNCLTFVLDLLSGLLQHVTSGDSYYVSLLLVIRTMSPYYW